MEYREQEIIEVKGGFQVITDNGIHFKKKYKTIDTAKYFIDKRIIKYKHGYNYSHHSSLGKYHIANMIKTGWNY